MQGTSIISGQLQSECLYSDLYLLDDQKRGASPFLQAWGQAAHRRQVIAICKRYNTRMKCKSSDSVVCSCKCHVVFCPKYRRPVLVAAWTSASRR